ncbi:MAG: LD-carboxypeptidase [Acidobacteria bacterium]|nr:LD-carboxypeptidase [Acidobacteriota bacterium]
MLRARLVPHRRDDPRGRRRLPGAPLNWTRPGAVRPGDLVGVCAPSGPVDPERLRQGVAELEALGFRVRVAGGALERRGFTAGTAEGRADDLRGLFEEPEVKAVFCTRGGAGAIQILERLDGAALAASRKAFVGYSDVTFLHLLLNRHGLVTFHGPLVAPNLSVRTYDRPSLAHALSGEGAPYATEPEDLLPLRPGVAEGTLRGGCLAILAAAAGTPWGLRCDEDTILFLEDLDEAPYRLDRMLRQLRASGALENVRGVVFGDMKGCAAPLDADFSLEDVVLEALDGIAGPVALGLSSGHTAGPNVTLPLGVRARLECGADARFAVLEPAVT